MKKKDPKLLSTPERIVWLDALSSLMDNRFRIPFTNIRFGFDFMIGLAPGIGDIFSLAISGILIVGMVRHGASGKVLLLMLGNVLLDMIVGSVPLLGDIFDLSYRANRRNFELFRAHHNEDRFEGSGCGLILFVVLLFFVILALSIWALVKAATWVIS